MTDEQPQQPEGPAVWLIYGMGIEDNTGELYAVSANGQHRISRVTIAGALRYVREQGNNGDRIAYGTADGQPPF